MVYINIVKTIVDDGGKVVPLYINNSDSKGTGLCNASILFSNGKLYSILRNVEYTLYCCEGEKKYQSCYEGPLSYYHRDDDLKLRTTNFFCELNPETLDIINYKVIDTSKLDIKPVWTFIGLEDARLIYWEGDYYACGVRRDTRTDGQGRMEFSKLEITDESVKEVSRIRIQVPDYNSYCEKNWMPIKNKPFHFVKWSNPTEIVKVDLNKEFTETVFISDTHHKLPFDLRGGSQLIEWDNDKYLAIVHECDFVPKNFNNYKDSDYFHRFIIWNKDYSIHHISESFNFMDSKIEFCIGLEQINDDIIITFGYQDNSTYIIKYLKDNLDNLIWNVLKSA
jgi:hypothetical protein